MKEDKILWESSDERLYIARTRFGFTLFLNGLTHAQGFLTFETLKKAIESGSAFEGKETDYIKKFIY